MKHKSIRKLKADLSSDNFYIRDGVVRDYHYGESAPAARDFGSRREYESAVKSHDKWVKGRISSKNGYQKNLDILLEKEFKKKK